MKVQVTLSDDLVKKIDEVAKVIGASRSSLCGMFIYHGMKDYLHELDSDKDWIHKLLDKQ